MLALHVQTGQWEEVHLVQGGHLPVRDVREGPGRSVWVVQGSAHLGRTGVLHTFDGREWVVFGNSSGRHAARWGLPPACLDAVAFDGSGTPYLLSGEVGLLRYEGGRWRQLTPTWPRYAGVRSLLITPPETAVIAGYDFGVLLVDLRSLQVRRVALRG